MKFPTTFLALCLSLAAPAWAQQAPASTADKAPVAQTVAPEALDPVLVTWLGEYGGVCAFTDDANKMVEMPIRIAIVSNTGPSHVEIESNDIRGPRLIIVINSQLSGGDRISVTPETLKMSPKYADPVSMDLKRVTGGFGGNEALIDGEVKVYQVSLNAAPRPVRTYRFRVGPE
ncbi:hypothetical protein [Ruficoccus sp. ZRK36]|uniref:hypothetical protein n=1 Tax=Ruficoccus sp. ZRK36 TaxID=2866311 RepID=UPI001C733971|nr:hypothetical protein [Ruficoccus sp. ZRK36]QYY36508.1 hypothetical protein K0V07_03325 [Ruficoccus sp. ZRK36]